MTYNNSGSSSSARPQWDLESKGEVSMLVMKAYAVSLLLLASVLVWTVGDAWMHFGSSAIQDSPRNNSSPF